VTPDADKVLQQLSMTLLLEIAPLVPVDYVQRNLQLTAMLLGAAVEEWDRAAQWRVEENAALRALFREAAPVVAEAGLRERLAACADGPADPSVRVSVLSAENDRLRALLIDLHAHLETLETPAARRVEAVVWAELARSTERRRLGMSPY